VTTTDRDLARIHLRAAADEVVEVLSDAIRSGVYEVGERLPSEQELAVKLGVSRTVLREAIAVLRRAGVVSVRRGATGGTFVEALGNINAVIAAGSHRGDEARPLLEARRAIEPIVACLTARRAADADLQELRRLVDTLVGLRDQPDEFYEVDIRFHLALGDMCGNDVLAEFHRGTLSRISVLAAAYLTLEANPDESLARQRQLCDAIASRSVGRVLEALDDHLAPMEERLVGERLAFLSLAEAAGR
jgi:DNA-binding FadR family transcriptional regulator